MRRRVAGRLDTVHSPRSVSIARRGRGRGPSAARRPAACPAGGALGPAPQRLLRDAALARDLDRPGEVRVVGVQRPRAGGSRPRSRPLGDRGRLAAVVGVRVGEDDQLDVSTGRPTWSSARSRWPIEPGSCIPVSTSTMPSPAASAQALTWGTPGQVERQPQPPDAGQHPLAAAHLSRSGRLAHRRHATVLAMAKKGRRRERIRAPESSTATSTARCSSCAAR